MQSILIMYMLCVNLHLVNPFPLTKQCLSLGKAVATYRYTIGQDASNVWMFGWQTQETVGLLTSPISQSQLF